MHCTKDLGIINLLDGTHTVNKRSGPERTARFNADIKHNRVIHRRNASVDLEVVFKRIKLSDDITPELCEYCKTDRCRCPAFTPETPCRSASSTPTSTDNTNNRTPGLVPNTSPQLRSPPQQSPSDEEADREVAAFWLFVQHQSGTVLSHV